MDNQTTTFECLVTFLWAVLTMLFYDSFMHAFILPCLNPAHTVFRSMQLPIFICVCVCVVWLSNKKTDKIQVKDSVEKKATYMLFCSLIVACDGITNNFSLPNLSRFSLLCVILINVPFWILDYFCSFSSTQVPLSCLCECMCMLLNGFGLLAKFICQFAFPIMFCLNNHLSAYKFLQIYRIGYGQ